MAIVFMESFQKYSKSLSLGNQFSKSGLLEQEGVYQSNGLTIPATDFGIPNVGRPNKLVFQTSSGTFPNPGGFYVGRLRPLSITDSMTVGFRLYHKTLGPDFTYVPTDCHLAIYDTSANLHVSIIQFRSNNSLAINYNGYYKNDYGVPAHDIITVRDKTWVGPSVIIQNAQTRNINSYYEFSLKMSNSGAGSFKLRRDGVELHSTTGVTTANSTTYTTNDIGSIFIGGTSCWGTKFFQDIYIADNLTSIGDVRIDAIFPSPNGANSQFSAVGNTSNHWVNVSDVNVADETAYDYAEQGSNLTEVYTMRELSYTPNTIIAIQTNDTVSKSDAGTASIKPKVYQKVSNTSYFSPTIDASSPAPISTSYQMIHNVIENSPFTSTKWTKAELANTQFGYTVP